MSFIERIGRNKVGFYCWKLFIINHFRGYEVRNVHIFVNKTEFLYFKFYSTDHCLNNYFFNENN